MLRCALLLIENDFARERIGNIKVQIFRRHCTSDENSNTTAQLSSVLSLSIHPQANIKDIHMNDPTRKLLLLFWIKS